MKEEKKKKQTYWFKVVFAKWEDETFDPESSFVFVEAWDVPQAIRKAEQAFEDDGEIIIEVIYIGYPQV